MADMIQHAIRTGDMASARAWCAEAILVGLIDGKRWVRELSMSTIGAALCSLPRRELVALVREVERPSNTYGDLP